MRYAPRDSRSPAGRRLPARATYTGYYGNEKLPVQVEVDVVHVMPRGSYVVRAIEDCIMGSPGQLVKKGKRLTVKRLTITFRDP